MANSFFKFKQFTVNQDICPMKVGTDGVLLGAWADCLNAKQILDIGSGTGLISLMLAQRNNQALVEAIDLNELAFRQSTANFALSPYADRLFAYHSSLQDFSSGKRYDLIVSNPPYFSDSLKSPDQERNQARHTDSLSLEDLVRYSASLLSASGSLAFVLPYDSLPKINSLASGQGLFLKRQTTVYPTPTSFPKRILVTYSFIDQQYPIEDCLVLEESRHCYTPEFKRLTQDFYL